MLACIVYDRRVSTRGERMREVLHTEVRVEATTLGPEGSRIYPSLCTANEQASSAMPYSFLCDNILESWVISPMLLGKDVFSHTCIGRECSILAYRTWFPLSRNYVLRRRV